MATRTFDTIVIGGGPGGYTCAIRLGQLKQKVVCIEKEEVGGVCLNWGCVPSKALITASHTYEKVAHDGPAMGLYADNVRVDAAKMQEWKDGIVKKLTGGVRGLLKGNGAELIMGTARVTSPTTVEVKTKEGTTETLSAKAIVVATGSSTIEIPSFKFDGEQIIGAREAVSLKTVPKRLLVIGGGVIGLELGSVYQKLGAELTVVEMTPTLLPGVEPGVHGGGREAAREARREDHEEAKAAGYEKTKDGAVAVRVELEGGKFETIVVNVVLVTVGMRPNGAGIGLEEIGVKVERGFVPRI